MRYTAYKIMEDETESYENSPKTAEKLSVPESLNQSIYGEIDKQCCSRKKQPFYRRVNRIGKIAAAFVLAMGIFTFCLYENSDAFRMQISKISEYVHEGGGSVQMADTEGVDTESADTSDMNEDDKEQDENSDLDSENEDTAEGADTDGSDDNAVAESPLPDNGFILTAKYIPSGYSLVKDDINGLVYVNDKGSLLTVDKVLPGVKYDYNTPSAVYSEHSVNGDKVFLYTENDYHQTAVWKEDELNTFIVSAEMGTKEFLQFIAGLVYKK